MANYFDELSETIRAIIRERGDVPSELAPTTPILECGLDSLDIASLVARLEERYGVDPFSDDSLNEVPQNLGQMAALYEQTVSRQHPQ
ncbi:hypothetical protein Acid345_1372 [Candidatus Koribacter versatilis Ellin345]|uniref:Carrier domain-containing protein n=1 Tax=Koribacter versatilis (strain Ellin345) TaxID=204669 RepID=Q1IRX6_KORVE|nr:acyl carrier protein [Candidatus Koribacter versatilis]ABF40374.1 hypothetical protein Acid345_1372 [Candidatus Koribacter versatilis Ellin345]